MNNRFSIVQKQNLIIITSVKSTIGCIFNNLKLAPCILFRFICIFLCLLMFIQHCKSSSKDWHK